MKEKILKYTSIMISVAVLATFISVSLVMYARLTSVTRGEVRREAYYLRILTEKNGVEVLEQETAGLSNTRITLVDETGNVLYDSVKDPQSLWDHEDRPEIRERCV